MNFRGPLSLSLGHIKLKIPPAKELEILLSLSLSQNPHFSWEGKKKFWLWGLYLGFLPLTLKINHFVLGEKKEKKKCMRRKVFINMQDKEES